MITIVLLISHLFSDFILQSARMVNRKHKSFVRLLGHGLVYGLVTTLVLLISTTFPAAILPLVVISVSHLVIDLVKVILDRRVSPKLKLVIYFVDQALYIIIIIVISAVTGLNSQISAILNSAIMHFGYASVHNLFACVLIYLAMMQPSAITIRNVLAVCLPSDTIGEVQFNQEKSNKAGYLIGILERVIIVTFVIQNQLTAIGFVLAAKSLARFKQLEDKEFAEKYLIGTLSSLAFALFITLIIKKALIVP